MRSCSRCGQDNPQGFRFCGACGSPLAAAPRQADEERKIVTVLFCDLVGFTARSDQADPEDVGAMLRPYHVRLRREIERFGGTLDKFIGDAVMAVFGAPAAHEDDPERAVRCAARLLEAIVELNATQPALALSVRIGITTGEALVVLQPGGETEGVVGDVVNTASRLQGVAPVNGVLVGEGTWRATHALFAYEELTPVRVKGKAQPVPVWRLVGARSRFGVDVDQRPVAPFIGRDAELDRLKRRYTRTVRERSVLLVTLLGELVGTWTVDGECYSATQLVWVAMLGCDDVDVTAARVTISGTWTFRSDMTYTRSLTVQTTLEFNAPLSCDRSVSDCASLDPGSYHSTCTGTGCCSCTQPQPQQTLNETGTYAVNGSSVKLTASGGNPLDWQYCVTGNMLSLTYASTLSNTTFSAHR